MKRHAAAILASGAVSILAAGCTVGPDYRRPALTAPAAWKGEKDAPDNTYAWAVETAWWRHFNDATLNSLVKRLAVQNLDVQEAAARVAQARAQTRIAAAQGLPSVNWAGSYTWTQQSERGYLTLAQPRPGADLQYDYYQNLGSASWDLDLFGMIRRSVEASRAGIAANEAARRGVALAVLSDLAAAYLRLRGTQEQIALTEHDLGLARHDLALVLHRQREGAATDLEAAQARARVAATEGALPPLREARSALINAIGYLLALPPRALEAELRPASPQPEPPPGVPVGFPSQLAERRPDLMIADARLHAATARIGAAMASFYPDITLAGNLGTQSFSAGDFFMPVAKYFTVGPTVNLPIFEGGKLRGTLRLRRAQEKEAALIYRQTVLNAWREVDDAMTAYAQAQARYQRVAETVKQNRLALKAARARYVEGAVTFLEVDLAEAAVLASETLLAASRTQINTTLVTLYKALGGGWQFADPPAAPAGNSHPV